MDNNYINAAEAKTGWNWGAFMMPLQFGIGNKAYLCLLVLVPLLNFIWMFVSGAKGAEWAYNGGDFASIEEFNASMRTWNRAGLVTFVISLAAVVIYFAFLASILSAIFAFANNY